MSNIIMPANAADAPEILALYKAQIGREFCPWDEHYPSSETIEFDLSRDSIFIMRTPENRLISAISIDHDETVEHLDCWSAELHPSGELSRIVVDPDFQNRGIAREMIRFAMDELKKRRFTGVHMLVNKHNKKAIASYAKLGFRTVGECFMYDQPFWCYEREL